MELTIAFILGLLFGSFLNVVILRLPKDESVVFVNSHCLKCKNSLKPWHNIPLFSWILLRGKCAFCKSSISAQYPIIELLSGVIVLSLAAKMGFNLPALFIACSFLTLLGLSMIDFRYKMVPDSLNLLALLFAILGAWSLSGVMLNFQNALLFAGGFTLLRFALSYILTSSAHREAKKTITSWTKNYHTYPFIEAMGEGDIMVAATMGALLGVKLTLVAIFLSALLALPVMLFVARGTREEQRVPFVPFLAAATFIVYIYDSAIMSYIEANY
ncbi:MAG: prepilin peptidase [Sulfurimonas sp.]|jgi:leader peptidase (prepilin peptidase)/N-methyltransferase|uniref:prepilin peptidase n=1 Tax=Sulfurimonas sp. TaxID=2022749 RepID=UPI002608F66C|nr:A24 family peptidase [Sulfurimonas sp.]MDD3476056.1 prepilin peptidase [Sulfurimonas sp.]